jgi:signal transduction histidine kinase
MTRGYRFGAWLLRAAAYAILLFTALPIVFGVSGGWKRVVVVALFSAIAVLLGFWGSRHSPAAVRALMVAQTALALSAFLLAPAASLGVNQLFYLFTTQAALFLPLREAIAWAGFYVVVTVVGGVAVMSSDHALISLAAASPNVIFGGLGAALRQANRATAQSRALLHELRQANERLHQLSAQAQKLAVAEERNRLAREMHDALGHRLTVAVVQLEGAERLVERDPDRARGMIRTMRDELKTGLAELRETVATLRQSQDDPLDERLERLTRGFQEATGLHLDLQLPPQLPELSSSVQHTLFRATQEGLTNIQKHADAERIEVALVRRGSELELTVSDDGAGPAPPNTADDGGGYGLQGLRERAGKLGGRATLEAPPGGGTRLIVTVPLEAGGPHDA